MRTWNSNFAKNANWLNGFVALLIFFAVSPAWAQKPSVAIQPKSQNMTAGLNATLTVTASGLTPAYQWQFSGTDLPGATTSALSLTNLQPANSGVYRVVLTNSFGSVTSAPATLVVGTVAVWGTGAASLTNLPLDLTNVTSVAAGSFHAMALKSDGTVGVWGDNTYGQTNVPAGLANVAAIAAGDSYCLALCSNGTVIAWGDNTYTQTNVPVAATNVVAIAAGGNENLAICGNGKLVNWGETRYRAQIPANLSPESIAVGISHYVALTSAGTVKAWGAFGQNTSGQLNVPSGLNNVVAIAAGANHTLALKGDGSVVAWGRNDAGECNVPPSATNVATVAAGSGFSFVLRNDGSLVAWGANNSSQFSPPAGLTNLVAISSGHFALGLRNFGSPVVTRGPMILTNWQGQPLALSSGVVGSPPLSYQWQFDGADIPGATNFSLSIPSPQRSDSGMYQVVVANMLGAVTNQVASLIMRQQVSIAAWGDNGVGECDVPPGLRDVVAISGGSDRVLVLRDDGSVAGWGGSGGFQYLAPTNLNNAVAISCGYEHNLALKSDWTVASWGTPSSTSFTNIAKQSLPPLVSIAAGHGFDLGLKSDGTVFGWYDGPGPYAAFSASQPPAGLTGVTAIACGDQHSLALKSDGTVVSWGFNSFGQTNAPPGLSNVVAISCGYYHSLALRRDGTVAAWGDNRFGQTNVPSELTNAVAITAGGYNSTALRADGTVTAWGEGSNGQTNVPAALTNVTAIAAGFSHSLALVGNSAPCISKNPRGRTTPLGTTVTFRLTATGTGPLAYRWQCNGSDVLDATNISLTISNLQNSNAGCYTVIVTNSLAAVTSQCSVLTLGPIAAWGSGEQAFLPAGLTNPAAIAAGWTHTVVAKGDGTVLSWGDPYATPPPLTDVVSVAACNGDSLALRQDGTVLVWGADSFGLLNLPAGLSNITAVAVGQMHNLALRSDGRVIGWGSPVSLDFGQAIVPADLTNAVAIAAGGYSSVALRGDGTVVSWGWSLNFPSGLTNIVAIAAGGNHNLALKADGTVVPWGTTSLELNAPRPDLTNIVAIGCGELCDMAIKNDGTLVVWGYNSYGQADVPAGLPHVIAASGGLSHVVALTGDGRPWITVQPFNRSVMAASSVTLNVMVVGNQPLIYQWQFNGTNIAGATGSALTLTNVAPQFAGNYRCAVSNTLGAAVSSTATLQVLRPPLTFDVSAITQPESGSGFKIRLTGLSQSGPLVLYSSTNLIDWVPIWTNTPVLGTWEYQDTVTGSGQTFYRASEQR